MAAATRRSLVLLALLCLVAPAIARADDFSEFRIPRNRALLWRGSLSAWTDWGSAFGGQLHSKTGESYEQLGSDFQYRSETDARTDQVTVSAAGLGMTQHFTSGSDDAMALTARAEQDRLVAGTVTASLVEQWFPEGSRLNFSADLDASTLDAEQWAATSQSQLDRSFPVNDYETADGSTDWQFLNSISGTLGAGLGRVRNATGVFEAMLVEQRLRTAGVLRHPLGPNARRDLAALLYARGDYSLSMEQPASTVWGALADILRQDGAVSPDSLDARVLFALTNPYFTGRGAAGRDGLPSSPVLRLSGWSARAIVRGKASNSVLRSATTSTWSWAPYQSPTYSSSFNRRSDSHTLAEGGVDAEFHRPVGLRWQFDAEFTGALPVRSGFRGFSEVTSASTVFIISERWLANASLEHARTAEFNDDNTDTADGWQVRGQAGCEYWVTDHIDVSARLLHTWDHGRIDVLFAPANDSSPSHTDGEFVLGLDYRFAGFTAIPGIGGMAR